MKKRRREGILYMLSGILFIVAAIFRFLDSNTIGGMLSATVGVLLVVFSIISIVRKN